MLKVLDVYKRPLHPLLKYKDYSIESTLSTGDKVLSFACPTELCRGFCSEMYVENATDSFVIKQTSEDDGWTKFVAVLNIEELEGKPIEKFETEEKTAVESLRLAFVDTGWTVTCSSDKKRTIRETNTTPWKVLQKVLKTYLLEPIIDTKNKNVTLVEKVGVDKGVYFMDSLNLRKLRVQEDSTDFCTRLIPVGKDGLRITSVNNGKEYLDNNGHSPKTITKYWKDERYTIPEHLKEDAIAKLRDMSEPKRSYEVEVIDLARAKKGDKVEDYSILSYAVGDVVTLVSKNNNLRKKQRIVKTTTFPEEPDRNTLEISNTILSFEELQQMLDETADTVDNITSDNGTVNGSTINGVSLDQVYDFSVKAAQILKLDVIEADIKDLTANNVTITGQLNAAVAEIGTIKTTYLKATDAEIKYATIENLNATNANIGTLNADYGKFKVVTTEQINAAKGWMVEGSIGSAQIAELSANKIRSGTIDTALVTIAAKDSLINISGNQIMVNDTTDPLSPVNRVILGKYKKADASEEYGILVRSADGSTVMMDGNGVHNAGITDGAINNNKVADDANIEGKKLDINSVITSINGASETISSTVIQVGDKLLNVLLEEQNNTAINQGKILESHATRIKATEDGIAASVTQTSFNDYTKAMGEWKTQIDADTQSLTTRVSATESAQTDQGIRITNAESAISQNATNISLSVKKDGVISAINLSKETVQIDAAKINLSGVVTVENLKNQGATTISGGTLTCTKGNFKNIYFANRITLGSEDDTSQCSIACGSLSFDPNISTIGSGIILNGDTYLNGQVYACKGLIADNCSFGGTVESSSDIVLDYGKGIRGYTNFTGGNHYNLCRMEVRSDNKQDAKNSVVLGDKNIRTYVFSGGTNVFSNKPYASSSDARLKRDFKKLDSRYLQFFDNLNPVLFNWKSDQRMDNKEIGFIAQEVEQAMNTAGIPTDENNIINLNIEPADNSDESPNLEPMYSLSYELIDTVAAYALQDARERIKELENKIAIMEG